jgi:transcriptional regulator with XRE-family HTH domain
MGTPPLPTVGVSDPKAKRPVGRTFLQVMPARILKNAMLRGVTISQLAKAAGISRSTLNEILAGKRPDVKVTTIERICHALGVSADALFGLNSVELCRTPRAGGIKRWPGQEDWETDVQCPKCKEIVPPRVLHTQTDCMIEMAENGESNSKIGVELGLMTVVVEFALAAHHEAQRHMLNA